MSEIGLNDIPGLRDLPALGIGMMTAFIQIAGMLAERKERLYRWVRYSTLLGTRCLM